MSEGRHPKERRKARRVATEFDVQLVGLGTPEIEAQVVNLSGGGFLAVTPRYFAPLTMMAMSLVLPPFTLLEEGAEVSEGEIETEEGAPETSPHGGANGEIHAEGIVVRCDPAEDGREPQRYSLAVAFLHLKPADHRRIEGYVQWRFQRSLLESAGA
jgi:hypothetical protein